LWRASSSYRPVRAMAVRKCSECCKLFREFRGHAALFVRGMIDACIFQWARRGRGRHWCAVSVGWLF
jgi:hypothetical protein